VVAQVSQLQDREDIIRSPSISRQRPIQLRDDARTDDALNVLRPMMVSGFPRWKPLLRWSAAVPAGRKCVGMKVTDQDRADVLMPQPSDAD
jgi:hypothetical protein